MSGRRRRSLLATVLRGGAVGRRIRVKSILLSSSRSDLNRHREWVRLEAGKAFIPVILIVVAGYLGAPLPGAVSSVLLAVAVAWACFVGWHAYAMAFRVNRRYAAYLKSVGIDIDLRSALGDRDLWRKTLRGMTVREFIAERRQTPPYSRSRPPA